MSSEVHVGDIGTEFYAIIMDGEDRVDVSGALELKFRFQRKDKTTFDRTAEAVPGVLGAMRYFSVSGDINQVGEWKVQAYVKLSDWEGRSDTMAFDVYANLPNPPTPPPAP